MRRHNGFQRRIVVALRNLDGRYRMVAVYGWYPRVDEAAVRVDEHPCCANTDCVEHGNQQCGFILAVAVTITVDIGRRMRLQSADTDLDTYITNLLLQKCRHLLNTQGEIGIRRD